MPTIEFFYDFVSPYSFLAATQLEGLAKRTGAIIEPKPFVLGAVFKAPENRAPATVEPKAAYMLNDLDAWAALYGVPFAMPASFPALTIKAMRMVVAAGAREDAWKLTDRFFRAYYSEALDLRESDVLLKLAAEIGLDGTALLAATESPAVKDQLKAHGDDAVARGAFGAPTFFVGDQMFVGNDRLQFVERAARGERVYKP